jgi:histone acetyltransferase HPA2-like acetyltransferase
VRASRRKKHRRQTFCGFFDGNNLVAVLDLIEKYPDKQTVFIGLFMVAAAYQGRGVGSKIVSSCFKQLAAEGYTHVRLGYVKTNPQAKSFWQKLGLVPTGIECEQEYYTVVVTDRII